jgi:hypothetical protein
LVQIGVTSADGAQTVWVAVDCVSQKEYEEIQQYLREQLVTKRHFESIAKSFLFAIECCPLANPSDLWQHIIYRTYLQTGLSEQSWKRASGQAFEHAFAAIYNPRLAEHGIRLVVLSPTQIALVLKEMGISSQVGQSKLDIAVIGQCGRRFANSWRLIGGIHAKASIAERISDDEPASKAMIAKGFFSAIVTLDSKSFPPPHGDAINRGELGMPRPGKRADKRDYFEEHGSFDACYSYNLRTPPSPSMTRSGSRINTLSFSERQPDSFVTDVVSKWNEVRDRYCKNNPPTAIVKAGSLFED